MKDRYRNELLRINNNIQFYKHKIALCEASNARIFYEKLLHKEAKRFQELQLQYQNSVQEQRSNEPLDPQSKENQNQKAQNHKTQNQKAQIHAAQNQEDNVIPSSERVFSIEELAQYNGMNGQPAYVAVNGIVYDVSSEMRWGGGTHFSMFAGKDLTANFNGCHGGNLQVLRNLPKVGIL